MTLRSFRGSLALRSIQGPGLRRTLATLNPIDSFERFEIVQIAFVLISWTMPVCEIDLRQGAGWHFVWPGSEGTEMEMRGVYKEITPPERLVHTESWGGDWPETLNTQVLTEERGKTKIVCTVLYRSKGLEKKHSGRG